MGEGVGALVGTDVGVSVGAVCMPVAMAILGCGVRVEVAVAMRDMPYGEGGWLPAGSVMRTMVGAMRPSAPASQA